MKKELTLNFEHFTSAAELSDTEKTLFTEARKAREKAYAPYSDFFVGCSALLENGEIISGSNQENAAFPSGLCAERTAIFYIGANFPEQKIKKIFIVGGPRIFSEKTPAIPPCGACRQSLMEYETKQQESIEVYFGNLKEEIYKVHAVKDLLPFYFDATFL